MVIVQFVSDEMAIHELDGCGVSVKTLDGTEATGVLERFYPRDGTRTMVQITGTVDHQMILATDIRNLAEIVVL